MQFSRYFPHHKYISTQSTPVGWLSKHTGPGRVARHIYNNLKLLEKMAIKSHRQTKLRDQCVLLRFYCENAKKKSGSCGDSAGGLDRKYETASGWSGSRLFIFWLKSAQKRKEAKKEFRSRMKQQKWLERVAREWPSEGCSKSYRAIYAHSSRRYAASG